MNIIDGKLHYADAFQDDMQAFIQFITVLKARAQSKYGVILPPLEEIHSKGVAAYINHNRWIVNCPDCNGAEFVWLTAPLYMCQNCWNGAINHKWRKVLLPIISRRLRIEQVIKQRPIPENRNWFPTETLEFLCKENEDNSCARGI